MFKSFCNIWTDSFSIQKKKCSCGRTKLYTKTKTRTTEKTQGATEQQAILPSSEASPSSSPFHRRQEALKGTMRASPPSGCWLGFWEECKLWFLQDPWRLGVLTNSRWNENSELRCAAPSGGNGSSTSGERGGEKKWEREARPAGKLNYAY